MSAIEVNHLSYTYSKKSAFEKKALNDVSFNIEEGDFVAIVGATGSGKSTLIQHLNGLIKIQDKKISSIIVDGMDASSKKTLKQLRFAVGLSFQYPEYQLFEDTLEKDVAFGPKNMKLPKEEIDRRVKNALDLVGLPYDTFKDRSPFDLSGGEKRRAAIAGVIAMEPKIIILDEPMAGLDPIGKVEIFELIKKIKENVSPTVIFVSHNMDDVAMMANKVIALKDGKVVANATPKEIFKDRELIENIGLDVPTAARIVDKLSSKGIELYKEIISMDELVEALKIRRGSNNV